MVIDVLAIDEVCREENPLVRVCACARVRVRKPKLVLNFAIGFAEVVQRRLTLCHLVATNQLVTTSVEIRITRLCVQRITPQATLA